MGVSASEEDLPLRPVPPDRYVGFEVAGEGAMGLVYFAHDSELKRDVAFKIVRPDGGGTGDRGSDAPGTPLEADAPVTSPHFAALSARFLQEARVTGEMEHPGIAPVYELGRTERGVPYYTMRFVRGQRTLTAALQELEGQPFEARLAALEIFVKLCDAVNYAHARGVLHRDLKPDNVALGEFGEVVLLDWGLASRMATPEVPDAGTPADGQPLEARASDALGRGTAGYMSPEALEGGGAALDSRSDVYSLGAILFQLLTGRLPFPLEPVPEYLHAVLHAEAPAARSIAESVPEELERLCAAALRRDRDARMPSVRDLVAGVRRWQTQSARDRQMETWLRDASSALVSAEEAGGPSRIRQSQRALTVLDAARAQQPEDARLVELQARARKLRNLGIQETQRSGRRRLLVVVGVTLLFLFSIVAFVVAAMLDKSRRAAERASHKADDARAEAEKQREEAEKQGEEASRLSREAVAATGRAEEEAEKARAASRLIAALVDITPSPKSLGAAIEQGVGGADGVFLLTEQARVRRPFARIALGQAVREQLVPDDLARAESAARAQAAAAYRAYERAGGSPQTSLRERRALNKARKAHARSQRDIFDALIKPLTTTGQGAPTLDQVQAALQPREVFVSYGRWKTHALAVVVDRTSKRVVFLGKAAQVDQAVSGFRKALSAQYPTDYFVDLLRRRLVEALALPANVRRVIVVPDGAALLLPLRLLLPAQDLGVVPSAHTFLHLRARTPQSSRAVLAVAGATGVRLPSMPGARAEAEAVGDEVLFGEEATTANLARALAGRPSWGAIHVGLVGRIAASDPLGAFLNTSPGRDGHGQMSAFEIARLDGRAELAVLATASMSARGAPESLALPQALLFAGARKILFSTLPADDEATRALLVRFHQHWKSGGRVSAREALERAQQYVRSQEGWEHPYYWGAWELWGL